MFKDVRKAQGRGLTTFINSRLPIESIELASEQHLVGQANMGRGF